MPIKPIEGKAPQATSICLLEIGRAKHLLTPHIGAGKEDTDLPQVGLPLFRTRLTALYFEGSVTEPGQPTGTQRVRHYIRKRQHRHTRRRGSKGRQSGDST